MSHIDERIIALSKTKILFLICVSLAFVASGLWMLQLDAAAIEAHRRFNSPALVHGIGFIGVAFFGLCGLVGARKMFDTQAGLVLNHHGILDNSSAVSPGLIPWSEIVGFDIFQVQGQKMLIVKVVQPEKYVALGGAMRQALNKTNLKLCGSPISISSNALKIDFDELLALCQTYLAKYGKQA